MTQTRQRPTRRELMRLLVERDGNLCQHPDCGKVVNLTESGKKAPTIDHWRPQFKCIEEGWTYEEIWDLSNLVLMHKSCNADKGDRIPNPDGTLPNKPMSKFRYRREKRAKRPEICDSCNAGRYLGPDEVCAACGSGPMPHRYPRWAKVPSKDCLHDGVFWCWACSIGVVEMRGATESIMYGGEGGEE